MSAHGHQINTIQILQPVLYIYKPVYTYVCVCVWLGGGWGICTTTVLGTGIPSPMARYVSQHYSTTLFIGSVYNNTSITCLFNNITFQQNIESFLLCLLGDNYNNLKQYSTTTFAEAGLNYLFVLIYHCFHSCF